MSSFLIKTCLKFHKCSDWPQYDIPEITPHEGGQTRSTPRKTEIPNMALEFVRQMQFNSMVETEFPVKIWTRSNPFKGVLSWFSCWWYPRYMHSQYMYFELGMYFLMNTLLISLLVVPTLAKNMVYSLTSALLVKIWANLKAPPEGELQTCWGPYTSPVITAILDVILKPMQSDSVGYWLFSCQISEL